MFFISVTATGDTAKTLIVIVHHPLTIENFLYGSLNAGLQYRTYEAGHIASYGIIGVTYANS